MRLTRATAAITAGVSLAVAGLAVATAAPAGDQRMPSLGDSAKVTEEWAADDLAAVASQLGAIKLPLGRLAKNWPPADASAPRRPHPEPISRFAIPSREETEVTNDATETSNAEPTPSP